MPDYFLKRINHILLLTVLTGIILIFGKSWLVPLLLSILLSMLLLPVCRWLEQRKIPRGAAVGISVFTLILLLAGFMTLLISQITNFSQDLPNMEKQANMRVDEMQAYIEDMLDIPAQQQSEYISDALNNFIGSLALYTRMALGAISQSLLFFVVVLSYIILLLLYRSRIASFLMQLAPEHNQDQVRNILKRAVAVSASYLGGVLTVVCILAVVNSIGLMLLGIPNAIFFGILAGILNIIPYIGSVIGSIIPVIFALLVKDSIWVAVGVAALFLVVQTIESYLLTPNITGSKISLNPLSTIIILLLGNLIWGIAGMILFIPMLGIVKVVFDSVSWLRPLGYLIGTEKKEDQTPPGNI